MYIFTFIMLLTIFLILPLILLLYFSFKSWKKGKKITSIILLSLFFLFVSPFVCDIGCNMCGLSKEQAYKRVIEDLKKRNLDIDKVKFVHNTGSCIYSFKYIDENKTIDYSILSTWLHGVKTTYYIEENNVTH